jgi:hypothetical protein
MNKGVSTWFYNVSTYSAEIIENYFSFKIHSNKKYIMEFGHTLAIVRKISVHMI